MQHLTDYYILYLLLICRIFLKYGTGNVMNNKFSASEGVAYIDFEHIVSEGDIIGFTEDSMERVVYVFNDGSFYSVIEPSPFAGEEAD